MPEGNKDHNSLENLFAELERKWPSIIERLYNRQSINDSLEDVFGFIALQRARVPASRDAWEQLLAERVKAATRHLNKIGKLPPMSDGHEDILDYIDVAIDPHQSIHSMLEVIKGASEIFEQIGLGILHNKTDIPFLTSDNPVIWFDPSVPEDNLQPYVLQPGGAITLLFPVSPKMMIHGDTSLHERFAHEGLVMGEITKRQSAKAMNRHVCRFAYKTVYSQNIGHEALIKKYANSSPVLQVSDINGESEGQIVQNVFGNRARKPKWAD